jgi:hypothetical protein
MFLLAPAEILCGQPLRQHFSAGSRFAKDNGRALALPRSILVVTLEQSEM